MKKILSTLLSVVLILLFSITMVGCTKEEKDTDSKGKNIEVVVLNAEEETIYNKKTTTESEKLLDALKNIDGLKVVTQDSDYGAFITTINDVAQDDSHFWNYYVNGEYATVGAAEYVIKDNDKFEFRLEKFE